MRRANLLRLLPMLFAAPAAAQAFEGTITANMPMMGEGASANYLIKGDKVATVMTLGGNAGPMAGKEMRVIVDRTAMTSTVLIATEMMGGKGMKIVTDLSKPAAASKTPVVIKELGTTDVIAGMHCDNFEATEGKSVTRICIARNVGMFSMPGGGPMMGGRGGGASTGWTAVFTSHPGFPLRVSDGSGKVMIEVTGVHPGSISHTEFVIPEGYMEMGGMGRMGGRGGGF